jgi:hypothetical protein
MRAFKQTLTLVCLGLAAFASPLTSLAFQPGVLSAKASAAPERIAIGEQTLVSVRVSDGFQKPIALASIKINTGSGYFESSNQKTVVGFTDKDGLYQMVWHSNLQTKPGILLFEISATKNGYIGKYPVSATTAVAVGDTSNPVGK